MAPPTKAELDELLETITRRVGRHLHRRGWLTRDAEGSALQLDREDTALDSLLSHSITYRIALGPRAGHKAFTLRSLPGTPRLPPSKPFLASATGRLTLTAQGQVRYTLKTPYRDGTTHGVFEPLDFMARLAALVPKPRAHLTRYHGVFAPHSRWQRRFL